MQSAARLARDEWLALACQRGQPYAFAELVREMERPLLYYVTKLLRDEDRALDVLQETWLRAFRSIGQLKEPSRLRPWLYRVAHGLVVDGFRREGSRAQAEEVRALPPEAASEESFAAEDAAAIHHALDELDANQREVLILHFLEDMPLADIATVIGSPLGTVKSRIFYAKQALREALIRGGYGIP
ncbi:MAG TPA: sigma-70 family RNA polymerase sigma factor [Pirellulales bacterium]|jgi:RNA polymerase sigma-70 factor (ECF subfamily)|nr:sigma-70 family RNA polymerase sigma factor [Pirellulales bacterium]